MTSESLRELADILVQCDEAHRTCAHNVAEAFFLAGICPGERVVRVGWPDFAVISGDTGHVHFCEVKFGKDELSKAQKEVASLLLRLGLDVRTYRVSRDGSGALMGVYEDDGTYDRRGMRYPKILADLSWSERESEYVCRGPLAIERAEPRLRNGA